MKIIILLFIAAFSSGCSNTIPEVSFLRLPSYSTNSSSFVDADLAGAKKVQTTDGYSGSFMVHGNKPSELTTPDQYQLIIRGIQY
ncbi:MAG: hypothetical protein ACXVCP_08670 [Bdellovibrio sp.]